MKLPWQGVGSRGGGKGDHDENRHSKNHPFLWFDNQAEEAVSYYPSIFKHSRIVGMTRYGEEGADVSGRPEGTVMTVAFQLDGQVLVALNGGPIFKFTEAISFVVNCESQDEADPYWGKLSAGGDPKAQQCGWLKGKYGLSWQIVPAVLGQRVHAIRSALHLPIERYETVIQDVEIPMEKALEFLEFYFREINIRPCWICPMRPLEAARNWTLFAMEPGALFLNFGFRESVRTRSEEVTGYFNRRVESIVQDLGGRKSLYSTSCFTEDEFWRIYNGDAYKKLREKFDPRGAFQGLYRKAVLGH